MAVSGFTTASFFCGLAPSLPFLIVFRIIQGACGGGLQPLSQAVLLESFAEHRSASVQHTLYAMGQAVIQSVDDVTAIHLVMPNKHHLPIDLSRLGSGGWAIWWDASTPSWSRSW